MNAMAFSTMATYTQGQNLLIQRNPAPFPDSITRTSVICSGTIQSSFDWHQKQIYRFVAEMQSVGIAS
jgi:hypothetical protein